VSTGLPEGFAVYLAAQDAMHARDVDDVLAALTERERDVVRQTAALGFEAGLRHPAGADHPKDGAVVRDVIGDRVPTVGILEQRLGREAAVMGYVQGRRYPDASAWDADTVLRLVVDAVLAHRDNFPILSGVRPCGECGHPQYAHRDGEDDALGVCLLCSGEKSNRVLHDYRRAARPAPTTEARNAR
jgi:hypothetical protein